MPNLNMEGPFDLSDEEIKNNVSKTSPGNYALTQTEEGTFVVKYVGRSDNDIRARLLSWAGKTSKYKRFKFSYADSAKAAFEKECHNYHDFGESRLLDNEVHPSRPENSGWKCPRCNIFD